MPLLDRLPVWCVLNAYGFLLDVLFILAGGLAYLLRIDGWMVWVPLIVAALVCAYGAIRIHSAYGMKRLLYTALLRRNRREIRYASFEEFVDVPCHRLTVRLVLTKVGHPECYREVIRRYYKWPWKRWPREEEGVRFF